MQKKFEFFFFCFLLFTTFSFSQKQTNIWCFGAKAMIDFNSGSPVDVSPSAMTSNEGCASIADNNGKLLFYTDGSTVYDKSHVVMPNGTGLKGNFSSTQSALITPHLSNAAQYYIFTVRGVTSGPPYELNYSVVDMNLPGNGTTNTPLGDIIDNVSTPKINFLTDSTGEKLTAIMHADSVSYWVVTSKFKGNTFYAYHVTCNGVDPMPKISTFNSFTAPGSLSSNTGIGYMKASADGKTIVAAMQYHNPCLMMFDFNNATGELSQPQILFSPQANMYGVEFSPNDSLIYAATYNEIYQYQRFASNVAATKTLVYFTDISLGSSLYAMQLATNGKIYFVRIPGSRLSSIDNPNKIGTPTVAEMAVIIGGGANARLGLPNFFNAYFKANGFELSVGNTTICQGDSVTIGLDVLPGYQYSWLPGSSLNNAFVSQPIANPAVSTTYQLSVINQCNDTILDSVRVNVKYPLPVNLGNDITICSGDSVILDASQPQSTYFWNPGNDTNSSITVSSPGVYDVAVTEATLGCKSFDTIHVSAYPMPTVNIGNDTNICKGDNIVIDALASNATNYLWLEGNQTNAAITISVEGTYTVRINDANACTAYDTIKIVVYDCLVSVYVPRVFTPNDDGLNDVFKVEAITTLENFNLFIYDRWGEIIFSSDDQVKGWDGKYKNRNSSPGIYAWKINYIEDLNTNVKVTKTGSLVLIR